eukprot:4730567-Alexandrium_andersonii.AAC.1
MAASGWTRISCTASQSRCREAAASRVALPWHHHEAMLTVAPRSSGAAALRGTAAEGQQGRFFA